MTFSAFGTLFGQAIAAPFWADLEYDSVSDSTSSYTPLRINKNTFVEFI